MPSLACQKCCALISILGAALQFYMVTQARRAEARAASAIAPGTARPAAAEAAGATSVGVGASVGVGDSSITSGRGTAASSWKGSSTRSMVCTTALPAARSASTTSACEMGWGGVGGWGEEHTCQCSGRGAGGSRMACRVQGRLTTGLREGFRRCSTCPQRTLLPPTSTRYTAEPFLSICGPQGSHDTSND